MLDLLLRAIEFAQLVENRKKKSDEVVCSRDSNWQHGAPLAISILIKLPILFFPLLLPASLEGVTTSSLIANLAVSSKSKRLATYTQT